VWLRRDLRRAPPLNTDSDRTQDVRIVSLLQDHKLSTTLHRKIFRSKPERLRDGAYRRSGTGRISLICHSYHTQVHRSPKSTKQTGRSQLPPFHRNPIPTRGAQSKPPDATPIDQCWRHCQPATICPYKGADTLMTDGAGKRSSSIVEFTTVSIQQISLNAYMNPNTPSYHRGLWGENRARSPRGVFQTLTQLSRFVSPSLQGSTMSNGRPTRGDDVPLNPRPQSQL